MPIKQRLLVPPNSVAIPLPSPFWPLKFRCRSVSQIACKLLISSHSSQKQDDFWTPKRGFSLS
jgi:hypothetical protein